MQANHKHYTLFIFAIITIVTSVLGYIMLYRTIVSQAIESSKVITEQGLVDEKGQYEKELSEIYNDSADEILNIADYAVSQDKLINFIETVESIGTTTGVQIELSAIDSANENLKAHVEMIGTWANIMRSLIILENIPYTISLNNIRLARVTDSASAKDKKIVTSIWSLSVNIKTIILK